MTARKKTAGRKATKSGSSRKRTSGTSSSKSAGGTKKSTSAPKRASTKRSPASPAKRKSSKSSSKASTGEHTDPKGRGLRGVGGKEERMYEHIKEDAQASGRYGNRAKEVAARTVMKMHKARGHRRGQ